MTTPAEYEGFREGDYARIVETPKPFIQAGDIVRLYRDDESTMPWWEMVRSDYPHKLPMDDSRYGTCIRLGQVERLPFDDVTPAMRAGFLEGDYGRITRDIPNEYRAGDIVRLYQDDGTYIPWWETIRGNYREPLPPDPGRSGTCIYLSNVERIPSHEAPTTTHEDTRMLREGEHAWVLEDGFGRLQRHDVVEIKDASDPQTARVAFRWREGSRLMGDERLIEIPPKYLLPIDPPNRQSNQTPAQYFGLREGGTATLVRVDGYDHLPQGTTVKLIEDDETWCPLFEAVNPSSEIDDPTSCLYLWQLDIRGDQPTTNHEERADERPFQIGDYAQVIRDTNNLFQPGDIVQCVDHDAEDTRLDSWKLIYGRGSEALQRQNNMALLFDHEVERLVTIAEALPGAATSDDVNKQNLAQVLRYHVEYHKGAMEALQRMLEDIE